MSLKNKKAVELSMNFLVVVILSIVVLSMGLVFVTRLFSEAAKIPDSLNQKTETEIARLLSSGERTAIYPGEITIPRGKADVFGLGVLNIASDNDEKCFYVNAQVSTTAVGKDGKTISVTNQIGMAMVKQNYVIENKDKQNILILAKVNSNAESGTYIIDVQPFREAISAGSCSSSPSSYTHSYSAPLKVYVKVP